MTAHARQKLMHHMEALWSWVQTYCFLALGKRPPLGPVTHLQRQSLQAGISQSGGSYGVNAALLELQLEPEDRIQSDHDRQLQSAIPGVRPANAAVAAGDTGGDASSSLTRQDDDGPGPTAAASGQVGLPCL